MALKCDQLFETQLRDVKVIQKLKVDIDHTKQNFHGRLRSICLDVVQNLSTISINLTLGSEESPGTHLAPPELEKAKADAIKLILEAITNRAFTNASEVTSRVNDAMKSYLRQAKLDLGSSPTPAALEGIIQALNNMLTALEDCLEAVIYSLFYQKVGFSDTRTRKICRRTSSSSTKSTST